MKRIKLMMVFALAFQLVNAQQPGDLDPTFGTNGVVQTAIGSESFLVDAIQNVVVQPDGKIIAMGSSREQGQKRMAYVRYNQDGSLDQSFGDGGKVIVVPTPFYGNFAMDAEVLSDGKIISCGYFFDPNAPSGTASSCPILVKMNANGTLDPSFGSNGIVIGDFGNNTVLPERMIVQKDRKIILTGYYNDHLMTLRYNADGSIDKTYGQDGFCVLGFTTDPSYAKGIALQDDNKVVIIGMYPVSGNWKWGVVRINENGMLDSSFGENGLQLISLGEGYDFGSAVKIQKDGKIIVAGHSWDTNYPFLQYSFAIARLNTDGSMDNSFGQSGIFREKLLDEGENYLTDLVLSPEGKIYASFTIKFANQNIFDMGVLCLNQDGNLDKAFGKNGYATLDVNGGTDKSIALDLQPDGKIVLGGESFTGTGTPFVLARYLVETPNSLDHIDHTQSFVVYPNPVKDVLNINYEGNFGIQVFDISGRMVMTANNMHSLDVTSLAAGNYVIKLIADKEVLTERIIKL